MKSFPSLELIKILFGGVFAGLRQLHEIGIVHRDIKPDNILLNNQMIPKIADFGAAVNIFETPEDDMVLKKKSGSKMNLKERILNTLGSNSSGSTSNSSKSFEVSFPEVSDIKKITRENKGFVGTPVYSPPESFYPYEFNITWDTFSIAMSMLAIHFGHSPWQHGTPMFKDKEIKDVYLACNDFIFTKKSTEEKEELYYLSLCRVVDAQLGSEHEKMKFDITPWTHERKMFSEFAVKCMRMNIETRLSVAEACEDMYIKNIVDQWEANPVQAGQLLRKKLDGLFNNKDSEEHVEELAGNRKAIEVS